MAYFIYLVEGHQHFRKMKNHKHHHDGHHDLGQGQVNVISVGAGHPPGLHDDPDIEHHQDQHWDDAGGGGRVEYLQYKHVCMNGRCARQVLFNI